MGEGHKEKPNSVCFTQRAASPGGSHVTCRSEGERERERERDKEREKGREGGRERARERERHKSFIAFYCIRTQISNVSHQTALLRAVIQEQASLCPLVADS